MDKKNVLNNAPVTHKRMLLARASGLVTAAARGEEWLLYYRGECWYFDCANRARSREFGDSNELRRFVGI